MHANCLLIYRVVRVVVICQNINRFVMSDIRSFTVSDDGVGLRLDKFLVDQMPEFSRSEIQRFKILLNGGDAPFGFSNPLPQMFSH